MRNIEHNKTCYCEVCGVAFDAAHYNAQTCSAKCRKAKQRNANRVQYQKSIAIAAIQAIVDLHKGTDSVGGVDALLAIETFARQMKLYIE